MVRLRPVDDWVTIREYRPEDLEAVLDIAVAAWQPVYASRQEALGDELFALFHSEWQADKRRAVREACEGAQSAMMCIAEVDGRVAGFASYYATTERRAGEIGNNAVHPDFQGQGIGTRMYYSVCDHLRALGMRCVTVETGGEESHAPARRAYAKAGFEAEFPMVRYYRKL